jgi:hypothetical protein
MLKQMNIDVTLDLWEWKIYRYHRVISGMVYLPLLTGTSDSRLRGVLLDQHKRGGQVELLHSIITHRKDIQKVKVHRKAYKL